MTNSAAAIAAKRLKIRKSRNVNGLNYWASTSIPDNYRNILIEHGFKIQSARLNTDHFVGTSEYEFNFKHPDGSEVNGNYRCQTPTGASFVIWPPFDQR